MRQKTELSAMPPVFSVEQEKGMAIITFYTDVQQVERENDIAYQAMAWSMRCPWTEHLVERIEAKPNLWLSKIKSVTEAEEAAIELERLKLTATDDAICELAGLVSDLVDAVTELATMIS